MATNEELALLIQQGHKKYITELWENCFKLLYLLSDKFYFAYTDKITACGYTQEDIHQGCFFVLLKMIKAYDPKKGFKFTSYANLHLKQFFNRTVFGYDPTAKRLKNPLNSSDSVDVPIRSKKDGSDTDRLVVDTLIDDTAERAFENAEDEVYNTELHNALEQGIKTLSDEQQAVIREMFYNSNTYVGTSNLLGLSVEGVRQRERYALRNLKTYNAKTKRLDSFRDDIIDTAYGGVGVSAFKNRQASSVESTVERLERERERMEQIKRECQENIRRTQEILARLRSQG